MFRPELPRSWREEAGAGRDELLFGFLGALRPEKNLELLLRGFALANIANARLALIGDGPCRPGLERLAAELGIGGRVIFAGRADQPALALPALDVFAMSSSTEQMSNAMLEAMATGLPVVTTNVGDSRELLGKEGGVVTPAGDLGGYASALRAMAESAPLRRQAGAANRRRAVAEYSNERMVRAYEALYREAVGAR
jgi:glycosyltransferase involved in cell wall biosynthesis